MPVNGRRGATLGKVPQKANRPPLAGSGFGRDSEGEVRVKGWGKSPPRDRQRKRHGKPHREQDRIGMTWRKPAGFQASHPGRLLEACRKVRPRGMAATFPRKRGAIQNPAYRPAGNSDLERTLLPACVTCRGNFPCPDGKSKAFVKVDKLLTQRRFARAGRPFPIDAHIGPCYPKCRGSAGGHPLFQHQEWSGSGRSQAMMSGTNRTSCCMRRGEFPGDL